MYIFHWEVLLDYVPQLLQGVALSLALTAGTLLGGGIIGLLVAFASLSRVRVVSFLARAYVEIFRNVPLLLIIFFVYFGLAIYNIRALDQVNSMLAAMCLYAGAYLAEVFRAAILTVDKRYHEAGRALGLSPTQIALDILLPLVFAQALPALSNNAVGLFKDTSLGTSIAVQELTFYGTMININTFRVFEAWTAVAAIYLITSFLLASGLRLLERYTIRWA